MQRKRSMIVRDRMTRRVTTVRPETRLSEAARLMRARKIRHLPVVDRAGRLVGMVTDRDLRQALFAPAVQAEIEDVLGVLEALSVGDIMTRSVVRIRAAASIRDAARLMYERRLGALPVVERERLIGLITETDVLGAFQELLGPARATAISP
jgi:acetoin utilization protein AcuB